MDGGSTADGWRNVKKKAQRAAEEQGICGFLLLVLVQRLVSVFWPHPRRQGRQTGRRVCLDGVDEQPSSETGIFGDGRLFHSEKRVTPVVTP